MSENKHTPGHITALSDQFICHPASRSIDEIEMAGEIMRDLLKQRDELLAFAEEVRRSGDTRLASMAIAAIASVKELK